jgi:hypothetical protein
MDLGKRGTA